MLIAVSGRRARAYIYAHRAQRVKDYLEHSSRSDITSQIASESTLCTRVFLFMKLIKSTVTFTLYGMRMYLQRSIGFCQGFGVWGGGSSIKSCLGGCPLMV